MNASLFKSALAAAVLAMASASVVSAATVTVDPNPLNYLGYMNVSQLPSNGGGFVFGNTWGIADLNSSFNSGVITLSPNTIGDPNSFWYTPAGGPGSSGNKIMEANLYVEVTDSLSGQPVTFEGIVLASTMSGTHPTSAFIKDFAPDYSSVVETMIPLNALGAFSVTANTIPGAGRHVQYGFQTKGVNVWATDVAPFGNLQVTAVPEPTALCLLAAGAGIIVRRRRA